jgi:hypothetical protein
MSPKFYVLMHLFGMFSVLAAVASLAYREMVGGPGGPDEKTARRLVMFEHGFGLLLMLVSGFGLLAKLGHQGVPPWAWGKVGIWLVFAAAPFLVRRFFRGSRATILWIAVPLLGLLAGYLVISQRM